MTYPVLGAILAIIGYFVFAPLLIIGVFILVVGLVLEVT